MMEQRMYNKFLLFFIIFPCLLILSHPPPFLLIVEASSSSSSSYKNYTVGDSLGWYDNLLKPNLNYQKWVAAKTFSLGDYLIFNTDSNHSVVRTYNLTTYKRCDYDNALDNDTTQWSGADPSATSPVPVSVAIPLVKEGMTYFFSSDYDGEQCKHGQHFKINVTHGLGLPDSLKDPEDQAPAPNSPDVAGDDSAPDTTVSSNFDHPQDDNDDVKPASRAVSISSSSSLCINLAIGILVLLGFLSNF